MEYINKNTIVIDDIHFDIKENVSSISTDINRATKSFTFYSEVLDKYNLNTYFILETPHHAAFAHWVFESAIFLSYFKSFKNAKILINKNPLRKYKSLFFKLFNINENNIIYLDNEYEEIVEYRNIPINNICIIPRHTTLCFDRNELNSDTINSDRISTFISLLDNFKNIIINSNYNYNKEIEHLFLPRNNIENYAPNDHIPNYSKIYNILQNKDYITYNTMETEDITKQIALIARAKNIYIDYGSAFTVNGFFSKNSTIYVNNRESVQYYQYNNYILYMILIDLIHADNNVIDL